jgi:hypothetical protein
MADITTPAASAPPQADTHSPPLTNSPALPSITQATPEPKALSLSLRLDGLLDAALATASQHTHNTSDTPSNHTQHLLHRLPDLLGLCPPSANTTDPLQPPAAAPPSDKTASSLGQTYANKVALPPSKAPAAKPQPPKDAKSKPVRRPQSCRTACVIFCFETPPPAIEDGLTLVHIHNIVNASLDGTPIHIQEGSYTRAGHIGLSFIGASTAEVISLCNATNRLDALMMGCPGTGHMIYSLEPDTPWHQVVINSVSISHSPSHADTYTALHELGEWNLWMSHALNTHKEAHFSPLGRHLRLKPLIGLH